MAARKKAKSSNKAVSRPAKKPAAKKKAPAPKARAAKPGFALTAVTPGITVNDLGRSIAWYRDAVGFVVEDRFEREGKLVGVQLRAGDVVFLLGQDDWQKGRDRVKGAGFRLYCMTTGDVDALAKKIEARGGTLDQQPTDQPWGMRDFALTDPDGFKITIAKVTKKGR